MKPNASRSPFLFFVTPSPFSFPALCTLSPLFFLALSLSSSAQTPWKCYEYQSAPGEQQETIAIRLDRDGQKVTALCEHIRSGGEAKTNTSRTGTVSGDTLRFPASEASPKVKEMMAKKGISMEFTEEVWVMKAGGTKLWVDYKTYNAITCK